MDDNHFFHFFDIFYHFFWNWNFLCWGGCCGGVVSSWGWPQPAGRFFPNWLVGSRAAPVLANRWQCDSGLTQKDPIITLGGSFNNYDASHEGEAGFDPEGLGFDDGRQWNQKKTKIKGVSHSLHQTATHFNVKINGHQQRRLQTNLYVFQSLVMRNNSDEPFAQMDIEHGVGALAKHAIRWGGDFFALLILLPRLWHCRVTLLRKDSTTPRPPPTTRW